MRQKWPCHIYLNQILFVWKKKLIPLCNDQRLYYIPNKYYELQMSSKRRPKNTLKLILPFQH